MNYDANEYTLEKANAVVGCEANREMEREISAAAVTVIKNENSVLPLKLTKNSKVLMLVPYDNERAQMIMAWNRAKQEGLIPDGAEVDFYRFNSATISEDLKAKLDWADTYIINSEISSTSRMEGKHWLSAAPYAFCDYAEENGKIAIISSVDKPYDVQSYPKADAIVAAYGCKGASVDPTEALKDGLTGSEATYGPNIIAAVEVILGTYGAQGKLPLDIPVYDATDDRYLNEISYERGYGLTYDAKEKEETYVSGNLYDMEEGTEAWVYLYEEGSDEPAYEVKVNSDGSYLITDVIPGSYTLKVIAEGYEEESVGPVEVKGACIYSFYMIKTASDTLKGDFNGDGTVNAKDAAILKRYVSGGWNVEYDEKFDLDGNGSVNARDVSLIGRYISGGWSVEL